MAENLMFLFLVIILQMGHCMRDQLKGYGATKSPFYMLFYINMTKETYFHTSFAYYTYNAA
jgi:hypothetical protein